MCASPKSPFSDVHYVFSSLFFVLFLAVLCRKENDSAEPLRLGAKEKKWEPKRGEVKWNVLKTEELHSPHSRAPK